jgi:predicted RNA methylase
MAGEWDVVSEAPTAAPAADPWAVVSEEPARRGFLQQSGMDLRRGVAQSFQGLAGSRGSAGARLEQQGGMVPAFPGGPPVPVIPDDADPSRSALAGIEAAQQQQRSAGASISRQQEVIDANPADPAVEAVGRSATFGEAWDAFTRDPLRVISGVGLSSLPQVVPGLVAGAVAGPAVGAGVMGATSSMNEWGRTIVEALQEAARERGMEATGANLAALMRDPALMDAARQKAAIRAGIIGTVDAASGGLASRALVPGLAARPVLREIVNLPAQMGAQMAAGAGGEALAQGATGEWKPGEIFLEAAGEGFSAPAEALAFSRDRIRGLFTDQAAPPAAPIPNATTAPGPLPAEPMGPRPTAAQMADDAIAQTAAVAPQGSNTTIDIGGQVRTLTPAPPPPAAAASSSAAPAQPPADAPATTAGAPPPPQAVAAPPGAPIAPPAAPGAAAVPPAAPAVGLAGEGVPPPASPPAPPLPGAISPPSSPPASPPVLPPISPPLQPNTTRADLEAALNAPSPEAQAAQAAAATQAAQVRATRIEALQAGLPPGWQVVDEQGAVTVLDPNGDWQAQFDGDPPADPASTLADARAAHQEGVRSGIYQTQADIQAQGVAERKTQRERLVRARQIANELRRLGEPETARSVLQLVANTRRAGEPISDAGIAQLEAALTGAQKRREQAAQAEADRKRREQEAKAKAKSSTGLEALGGAGAAMAENMRAGMWEAYEGASNAFRADPAVRAAKAVAERRRREMDRPEFDRFLDAWGKADPGPDRLAVMNQFLGQQAPAPAPTSQPPAGNVTTPAATPGNPTGSGAGNVTTPPAGVDTSDDKAVLRAVANEFGKMFLDGRRFATIAQARIEAARILGRKIEPGTPLAKVVDEAIELGVVVAARRIVNEGAGIQATYAKLVDLYDRQPRLGTRTSTSIENQAYSTPAPLAFIAAMRARIDYRSTVLEPTAGTGMLTITANPQKVEANELDPLRREALRLQGFEPSGQDAARWTVPSDVDAVIANPPFGITKDRDGKTVWFDMSFAREGYETSEIDHAIALRALEAMKAGGRAVLLLGGINKQVTGDKARAEAYLKSRVKREFFVALYDAYRVVDHFTVAGELYSKQGAGWPIDVIVIAGKGKSALPYPTSRAPQVFSTWDALKEKLNDGRVADSDGPADGVGAPGDGPQGDSRPADGGGSEGRPGLEGLPPADGAPAGVAGGAGGRPGGRGRPAGGEPQPGGVRNPTVGVGESAGAPGAGGGGQQPGSVGVPGPAGADGAGQPPGAEPTAGGAGAAADQSGGLAGGGDTGGGRPDVGAAFDAALDDVFGPEPAPVAAPPPAAPRPPRTAGEAAASAVKNTAQGADQAMAALTQLFGGGKRLGSGPSFDDETWKAAKPLFQAAAAKFQAAGRDIAEVMRLLLTELRDAYQWTRDMVTSARPYIERFVSEVTAGKVNIGEKPAAPAPETETAPPPPKPRKQDAPTDRQVAYEPGNDAPGVGTLVPVNMQTAVSNALAAAEQRAGMPLVDFVAERLGYKPAEVRRYFSAEQVDAIALGINNLDDGQGFVIGDQTGVGKGRFVAAMIRYALRQKLIPVFVTEKDNLYKDMARDLTDIGMQDALDRIIATNSGLSLPLTDEDEGVKGPRLKTLSTAAAQNDYLASLQPSDLAGEKIIFTTYTQMQQQAKSDTPRIRLMRTLAPQAFLILDESHNAGGAAKTDNEEGGRKAKPKGTDRGTLFRQFLDSARSAVFSSATWAKRPDVMDLYGRKTGMRFAVPNIADLGKAISKGGVPMQQIVSAMLARAGQYIRRERSFAGVTYDVQPVSVDRETYDDFAASLAAINKVSGFVKKAVKGISNDLKDKAGSANDGDAGGAGAESTAFAAVMHNLIGQMLLASKAKEAADTAIAEAKAGHKPVITVANTMGSFIEEYAAESGAKPGDRIDLTFNDLLLRYLGKVMTYRVRKPFSSEKAEVHVLTPEDLGPEGEAAYRKAERLIESLDLGEFPLSPIDYIHARLAEAGLKTGEITGRTETLEYRADGGGYYRRRPASENTAKGKTKTIAGFNSGSIDAVILNQSGATGLSLHASEKFKDQRQRVMILAQAEANIDTHMQMLGRVHRTGQVITPRYLQLFADVPAEKRPAAVLAKKMAGLSAATTANRQGALSAEGVVDFLNEYGDDVVFDIVDNDSELWRALGEPKIRDENDNPAEDTARKVSGRIPLLPLAKQEEVYQEIEDRYRAAIAAADESGTNKLEAKTLDLDAKSIEEKPWTEGKGYSNIFSGPSRLVLYDVRKQTRPPTPQAIVKRVAESAGLEAPEVGDKTSAAAVADMLDTLALNAEDKWLPRTLGRIDDAVRIASKAIEAKGDEITDKERRVLTNRITDNSTRLRTIVRLAQPGALVGYNDALGDRRTGLVLEVKPPKAEPGAKFLSPSGWDLTILTPEGERIQRAVSGVFTAENKPADDEGDAFVLGPPEAEIGSHLDFIEAVTSGAADRREERWIVTGNLLAGYAKRAGTIVNFYTADGDLLQGVMMPTTFDPAKFEASQLPKFTVDQALAFLFDRNIEMPQVETEDGAFSMARDDRGSFVLRADGSKAKGGAYFLDRALREAIGKDFVKSGDAMRVRVEAFDLRRARDAISNLLVRQRRELVSKHAAAKAWGEANAAAPSAGGGVPLYANPLDPAAFKRFMLDPAMAAFRAAADKVREADLKALRKLWPASTLPAEITVDASGRVPKGPMPVLSHLRLPNRMFRQWPSLAGLVEQGARAEERMSIWSTRMGGRLDRILGDLKAAGGELDKVQAALLDADANEVDIEKAADAAAHWQAHELSPAEIRAAADLNRLLVQVARLVDQHRRAMLPKVRAAKAKVFAAMQRIADSASVPGKDYAALYRRRTYLAGRIRAGKGDLVAQGREVEDINTKLRAMRAADPALQERLVELQADYDALEARLQESSVRRRKGYFPHKFFGSWRLFEIGEVDPETGEPTRTEITSDQGFYDTQADAIAAAQAHLAENPGAKLRIEPRMVSFPAMGGGGAVLSDAAYRRLRAQLEKASGLEGEALNDALKGVARRRSRRRVLTASLLRKGAEGFARDIERVMRTHIAQATRYVEMDKLKFRYVETSERLGLSPARAVAVRQEGMAEVQRSLEAWWRDINGSKQPGEQQLDGLIEKLGLPGATATAFMGGFVAGGGFANPILAPMLGTYLGYRMARAMKKGGDFPTRTFMADISSDMAHLKLGMLVNIASAVVNLTQTAINTYPVLGEKWTGVGLKRAVAALKSQMVNAGSPGRMSTDAILLTRADIRTRFSLAQDAPPLLVEDRGIGESVKKWSMMPFTSVETFNRATAFLGAYARAEAEGASPAAAMEAGRAVLRRTQFHQGQALRPEVLRNHLLRLPTQFKNFMAQQIGFVLGLKGKGEILRFAVGMFLVAGLLGLPGLQLFDWLTEALTDFSPLDWVREQVILAGSMGSVGGSIVDVLARGFPTLLGVDISQRVGMGPGFLPESGSDVAGPAIGTVAQMREAAQQNAQLVDYLAAMGGFTGPLRALEAAANGSSITSARFWSGETFGDGQARMTNPRKRDQTEYRPTDGELAATALGFRPLRQALQTDQRTVQREETRDRQRDQNAYLARIIQARWDGRQAEIPRIAAEARRAGVMLTQKRIVDAIKQAEMDRTQRDLKQAPRDLRPAVRERQQAIEQRFQ